MNPARDERLGLTVGLEGRPLRDGLALCGRAEELGYTDLWSAEVAGPDAFAALAPLAVQTKEARLGTAIVPALTRPPALVAMGAATLQDLSDGRFVLGMGTSSSVIVEKWMGGSFDRPLTRLREYVQVVRDALNGKKVGYRGETISLEGFRIQMEPRPVPIYLAALGPRACRLAGEIADGVIFFLKTQSGVEQAIEWLTEGARSAGRDATEIDVVMRIPVAVDEDEQVLSFMARRLITTYAAVDVYNRSLASQGFAREAAAVAGAWAKGDREGANEAISDELVRQLIPMGDLDSVKKGLGAFRDAGVATPVLLPVSVSGDPDERAARIADLVERLAPARTSAT